MGNSKSKSKGKGEWKDKCQGQGQGEGLPVESVPKLLQGSSDGPLSYIKEIDVSLIIDLDMPKCCAYVDDIVIMTPQDHG